MPKLPPEIREKLEEVGIWKEFWTYRKRLVSNGENFIDSTNHALEHVYGEDSNRPRVFLKEAGNLFAGVGFEVPDGVEPEPLAEIKAKPKPATKKKAVRAPRKKPAGSGGTAKAEDFTSDQVCTEADNIRWVAANMEIKGVKPHQAPSPTAWGMLTYYASSELAKGEFWKSLYTKLVPTRAQIGDEGTGQEVDGKPTIDNLERIRGFRDKAKGESG